MTRNKLREAVPEGRKKIERAIRLYRQAMQMQPDDFSAYLEYVRSLQKKEDHEQAVKALTLGVQRQPENSDIRNLMSVSLESLGKLDEALHHLQIALRFNSNNPVLLNNIGILYLKLDSLEKAIKAFQKALIINPNLPDTHHNLSIVFRKKGDRNKAMLACRKALSINPNFPEALHQAGLLNHKLGKLDEAQQYYKKAIENRPDFPEAYFNLGNLLKDKGQFQVAVQVYQKAIQYKPDFHRAIGNMGNAFMFLGDDKAAISCWENAIGVKPDHVQAYAHIVALRHFKKKDRFVVAMETLLADPKLSVAQKIHLNFALSKAYGDLKNYDRSFQLMAEGNRLRRKTFDYDETIIKNEVASIKTVFREDWIKERNGYGCDDQTPIFIIGMPRSGTSLVEQILSSHPDVFGAGELYHLDAILSAKSREYGKGKFPEYIHMLRPKDFKKIGLAYVREIRKLAPKARFITDKMPQNFLFVGMIKLILPRAKIIHCRRSPMDTCFSIFKTNFTKLHKYSHSLKEIGFYYRLYQDLMKHWHDVSPDCIYDICYEELVSDPDYHVRAIIEYCNLDWSDDCLNFHRSRRPVMTASTQQVRRPFYRDSIELWRNYKKYLFHLHSFLGTEEN